MSMIQFIKSPFPDNHNGFDYTPKSFMDVQKEHEAEQSSASEVKLLSLLKSIFK